MAAIKNTLIVLGLGVLASAIPVGNAQTLKASSPQSLKPASMVTRPAPVSNSWICASGVELDVQPVSFDGAPSAATAWVVVYRQNGEIVASERVTAKEAENLPAYDCDRSNTQRDDRVAKAALIG